MEDRTVNSSRLGIDGLLPEDILPEQYSSRTTVRFFPIMLVSVLLCIALANWGLLYADSDMSEMVERSQERARSQLLSSGISELELQQELIRIESKLRAINSQPKPESHDFATASAYGALAGLVVGLIITCFVYSGGRYRRSES